MLRDAGEPGNWEGPKEGSQQMTPRRDSSGGPNSDSNGSGRSREPTKEPVVGNIYR